MNAIKFLTNLLVKAYQKEAARVQAEADKLGQAQAAEALNAVELAKQAEIAREQSIELGRQKTAAADRAAGIAARGKQVETFFLGDVE